MAKIYECARTHTDTNKQINKIKESHYIFSHHLLEFVHYKIVVINDQA